MIRAAAKFDDLLEAFEFVSAGQPMEHEAYLCTTTGVIHYHSEYADVEEPLPDDIADSENYIAIPHKNDLGLGKRLVLQFAGEFLPEALRYTGDLQTQRSVRALQRFAGAARDAAAMV